MAVFRWIFLFCVGSLCTQAQSTDRYMVFFKDKVNTPYVVTQPSAFLSARAIARRQHSAISVSTDDLPVTPSYVTQVRQTGVKAFFTSRWMNAVLVEATAAQITSIKALSFVSKADFVAPGKKLLGGRTKEFKQKNKKAASEATKTQLQMIGLDAMHTDGFNGENVMISLFDSGYPGVNSSTAFQPVFNDGRVKMTKDFVTNSGNVYQFDSHGSEVFSIIAAQIQDSFSGGAAKADYLLFVTEDAPTEYKVEEYNWLFAAEKADSAGADVIQSSLGYNIFDDVSMNYTVDNLDGKTAVVSKAAGMARDRGIIVVVSAGNEGTDSWHYITPPADVDGILAIGAIASTGGKVGFSSFGPSSDGRIKPDVVALGQGTSIVLPGGTTATGSGTSFASPLVASLVAGLLQAYPQLTPAELVQAIKLSASKGNDPDNSIGYGIPNYTAVKNYLASNEAIDEVYVFPNPTDTVLNLSFKKLPEGPVDLSFYDAQGKQLSNPMPILDWFNNPVQISIANLAAGNYFLKVKTSSMIKTFRFVKL